MAWQIAPLAAWSIAGIVIIPFIFRILLSLGIGIAAYKGLDAIKDFAFDEIVAAFSGLPPQLVQVFSTMRVDEAINVIFAAFAIRLTLNGMTSAGVLRQWRLTEPQ